MTALDAPEAGVDQLFVLSFVLDAEPRARLFEDGAPVRWGWISTKSNRGGASFMSAPAFRPLSASAGPRPPNSVKSSHTRSITVYRIGPREVGGRSRAPEPRISSQPQLEWEIVHDVNDLRPLMEDSGCALADYLAKMSELVRWRVRTVVLSGGISRDMTALAAREAESVAPTSTDVAEAVERLRFRSVSPEGARSLARRAPVRFEHRRLSRLSMQSSKPCA